MKKLKKWQIAIGVFMIVLVVFFAWTLHENNNPGLTEYVIKSEKIPESFSGYKIAQVSDLHNAQFGKNNEKIINILKNADVDMIVITGDYLDSRNTHISVCLSLAKEMVKIAPVYYINGNHEPRVIGEYTTMKIELEKMGVTVLENQWTEIEKNGEKITLSGLYDVGYLMKRDIDIELGKINTQKEGYNILLAHRPDFFEKYSDYDLVFSGHSHGGQVRLPFIGGLFAPGQGVFPKYDGGLYTSDTTTMVVSRGLGNSVFPVRINNKPEIVVVTLERG